MKKKKDEIKIPQRKTNFIPRTHRDLIPENRKRVWKGNILRLRAEQMAETMIELEEVWQVDMTNEFFKEIEREIMNREIVKIQINSKPRLGKSTEGIALGMWIKEILKKHFPENTDNEEFGMQNMARDDQEHTKKMRNPDLMFEVIVTDESNALEKTGENATTEQAQKEVFSDIQAGRYVHGVDICPEGDMDKNTDIKLEVRNRQDGIIHNYLYYKLKGDWIPLGFVDIRVDKLIKNWKGIEPIFFRYLKEKRPEDKELIEKWCLKDFYILYMVKKYEKMELMNREKVARPRELEYAGIELEVINKFKKLVGIMSLAQLKNPTQIYLEMGFKNQGIIASMIGIEMSTRRVMGVLGCFVAKNDIKNNIKKTETQFQKGKITEDELEYNLERLSEEINQVDEIIDLRINELERYKTLNEKYNKEIEKEDLS